MREYVERANKLTKEMTEFVVEMSRTGSLEKYNEITSKIPNVYHEVGVLTKDICDDYRVKVVHKMNLRSFESEYFCNVKLEYDSQ